jgi:uncharacterized membrane protein HdeD (DUF308 family)
MKRLFSFKHARIFYGVIIFILGLVFAMVPMIPLGYIFLFLGAYLLQHKIPIFSRFMIWLRKRDKKGKLEKFENKVDKFFSNQSDEQS